ncbi:MAG: hypothetical protein IPM80_02500 [Proteobacteria bacterium]|nr:hypothetical protein [Pseudomonadota bacterium]
MMTIMVCGARYGHRGRGLQFIACTAIASSSIISAMGSTMYHCRWQYRAREFLHHAGGMRGLLDLMLSNFTPSGILFDLLIPS